MPSEFLTDNNAFRAWLDSEASRLGLEAAACVRLDSPGFQAAQGGFSSRYGRAALEGMPEYVLKAQKIKARPASYASWAASAIVVSGSFRDLPDAPSAKLFKLSDPASPLAGLMAGYELKLDYHSAAMASLRSLASDIQALISPTELRFDALCDSNPLPERGLALYAGLGTLGIHRCLLSSASDSAVYCAALLCDLKLPESLLQPPYPKCNSCGACASVCANKVLGDAKRPFDYSRCVAAIGSESRGSLSLEQVRFLGPWVSGCGECLRDCHSSKLPPPVAVDLEWLLLCPTAELSRAIEDTPLTYEGPALLRRNALAVLFNKGAPEGLALISKFKDLTGSSMLRSFAESLLNAPAS